MFISYIFKINTFNQLELSSTVTDFSWHQALSITCYRSTRYTWQELLWKIASEKWQICLMTTHWWNEVEQLVILWCKEMENVVVKWYDNKQACGADVISTWFTATGQKQALVKRRKEVHWSWSTGYNPTVQCQDGRCRPLRSYDVGLQNVSENT